MLFPGLAQRERSPAAICWETFRNGPPPIPIASLTTRASSTASIQSNKVQQTIANGARRHGNLSRYIRNYNIMTRGYGIPVIGTVLNDPNARANMRRQLDKFLAANPNYHGISLDFEDVPDNAQAGISGVHGGTLRAISPKEPAHLHQHAGCHERRCLIFVAAHTDGIVLMNYDQHEEHLRARPDRGRGLV